MDMADMKDWHVKKIEDNTYMSNNKKRKTMVSVLFMEFSIIFTVCLIASNILETKQMVFRLARLALSPFGKEVV